MWRKVVVFLCLLASSLACNLTSQQLPEVPAQPNSVLLQTMDPQRLTPTILPTVTRVFVQAVPLVTQSPVAVVSYPTATVTPVCISRVEWPTYNVQPGDTLSRLAAWAGSSVEVLAAANCLDDPGSIRIGQILHVPAIPMPTAAPSATGPLNCSPAGFFFVLDSALAGAGWCPDGAVSQRAGQFQQFERGYMLWWTGSGRVYVLLRDPGEPGGQVEVYAVESGAAAPDAGVPPADRFAPYGVFAQVWGDGSSVMSSRLGWAIAPARAYAMAMQAVSSSGATISTLQWGPAFFAGWPLDDQVLGIGGRTWRFVGLTGSMPASTVLMPSDTLPATAPAAACDLTPFFGQPGEQCPAGPAVQMHAAYEPFENGHMIWRSDRDEIYALFPDGSVFIYPGALVATLPDNPVTEPPPAGRFSPVSGFGRVWGSYEGVRAGLGWALAPESAYTLTAQPISPEIPPDQITARITSRFDLPLYYMSLPDGRVLRVGIHTWYYQ